MTTFTSLNNRCSTSRYWNRSSIDCYGFTSGFRKRNNWEAFVENRKTWKDCKVSCFIFISSLISKALWDDSISDEEYSLILLEFETFTRMIENLRVKSKMSLQKTGNIETEANELLRRNKIGDPTWVHVQNHVQNRFQNYVRNHVKNHVQTNFETMLKTIFKTMFQTLFKTVFKTVFKK